MLQFAVTVRNAEIAPKRFEETTGEMLVVGRLALYRAIQKAVKVIKAPPPRFEGDFEFASDRQRIAVMAAFAQGEITIPYKRTGGYAKSWKIIRTDEGYDLVSEGVPYVDFVGGGVTGLAQARIHQGRWAIAWDAIETAVKELPDELPRVIAVVATRRGY